MPNWPPRPSSLLPLTEGGRQDLCPPSFCHDMAASARDEFLHLRAAEKPGHSAWPRVSFPHPSMTKAPYAGPSTLAQAVHYRRP